MTGPRRERGEGETRADEWLVAAAFLVAAASAVGLALVYWQGGQPQAEGVLLAAALGGLGAGLVVWAHRLLPQGPFEERREPLAGTVAEQEAFGHDLAAGRVFGRRRLLVRSLALAAGALGLATLFPIRSLGPGPGQALERTPWRRGRRLVAEDGRLVRDVDVPLDGLVTVFPEGHAGSADGQAVLVRVAPGLLRIPPERRGWSPGGLVAFSKVCTHAGCPVGLYQPERHQLLCPCHQSAFDVLEGARPVFGPAARALPQLPLAVDDDGFVVARGDFSDPVGPAWWNAP